MRILMLNYEFPPLGGGTANANYYLLKEYAKQPELKLDLITGSSDKYKVNKFSKNITIHYLNIYKNNKNLHYQSYKDLLVYSIKSLIYAWKLRLRNKYDLVHSFYGIPCAFVAMLLFKPYIVSLRGSDVPFYNRRFRLLDRFVFVYLNKLVWGRARCVVANSSDLKALALKTTPNLDIKIIPNGVDTEYFIPDRRIKKEKAILFVGRLIKRKRADLLLRAFGSLPEKTKNQWRVWIVGSGPEEKDLKNLAKKLGIEDAVKFFGQRKRNDLKQIYLRASLFVLPSENEGMSNTVLEAVSSGLPAIVTDTGGNREIISNNNGIIIRNGSAELKRALKRLIKNDKALIRSGEKSRNKALSFGWDSVGRQYLSLYTDNPYKLD